MPTSKSARRVVIGERMRMNAPNVPNRVGAGMKYGIAHVDAVNLAREVVPHFVREQNAQQRERKRNAQRSICGC